MNRQILVFCFLLCLSCVPSAAQKRKSSLKNKTRQASTILTELQNAPAPPLNIENSPALQTLISKAVSETVNKFAAKGFTHNDFAVTLINLRDPNNLTQAAYHGEIKIYPASVVKMFYLAAAHQWLEEGKIKDTPELERALRDMIVDSSNDATHFVVDVLTDTSSGAELLPKELETFAHKRNAVNRYFSGLGYENINVCQKTYCEDAYGREQQFRGKDGVNRNKLTTNATARLLAEIVLGKAVSPARSEQMMELLRRDPLRQTTDADNQDTGFTGIALKQPNVKLWSKAGWTSKTRHDAAYVETPDGLKFILVTFTENHANERDIIPTVAEIVLAELGKIR